MSKEKRTVVAFAIFLVLQGKVWASSTGDNPSFLYYDASHPSRVGGYGMQTWRDSDCEGDYEWTEYFNIDTPNDGVDKEHICLINELYPKAVCRDPIAVQAVTINGVPAELTGQLVTLNKEGLICYNVDQWGIFDYRTNVACYDYAVRFCCPRQTGAPEFMTIGRRMETEVNVGDDVTLECRVSGLTQPHISWFRDDKLILKTPKYCLTTDGDLTIRDIGKDDQGRYFCVVNYNQVKKMKKSIWLKINVPDNFEFKGDKVVWETLEEAHRLVHGAYNATQRYWETHKNSLAPKDLFKKFRKANKIAQKMGCASEVCQKVLETVANMYSTPITDQQQQEAGCGAGSLVRLNAVISPEVQEALLEKCGCEDIEIPDCSSCFYQKYRSADGTCNNLQNPRQGAANQPFLRTFGPLYEDGFSAPVGWNDILYNGFKKPSTREVSSKIMSTDDPRSHEKLSLMVMQWGQFIDHDLDLQAENPSRVTMDGEEKECDELCKNVMPCFPIIPPEGDPRLHKGECLDVARSTAACGTNHAFTPREQINTLTSYIDASMVYGNDQKTQDSLRDLNSKCGLLRVNKKYKSEAGNDYLPMDEGFVQSPCIGRSLKPDDAALCFLGGDVRTNEVIQLTATHTIFMREHNRIANQLCQLNPHWDSDRIFQETRKIVYAQIEKITYSDFLPKILGPKGMAVLGTYGGYDPTVDASVANVFAAAAYRFGHGTVQPMIRRMDRHFNTTKEGDMPLHFGFFSPFRIIDEGGTDPLYRGLYFTPLKRFIAGKVINNELTEKLFDLGRDIGLDLIAINIQRGRDHGLPMYNDWREFIGLKRAKTFDDFANELPDAEERDKLKSLYGHPDNVDLFPAAMSESKIPGSILGPTFNFLIAEQFKRSRAGDRFWYQNPGVFTQAQLDQLKLASIARIICDTGDNITRIQKDAFLLPEYLLSCDEIPSFSLFPWKECCEECQEKP